ncbi:MAG TPA: DUF362 domain-containing protein [Polyangiales bacterium]|nr:DUF362 domain-containing protein [Polyangiales bacterium]
MADKKDLDALTRRVFLQRGATLATVAPFVINLSACASSNATDDASDTSKPDDGGADASEPSETEQQSESASAEAERADVGKPAAPPKELPVAEVDTLPAAAVLLSLQPGDGVNAVKQALEKLDLSWLEKGDSVLIKVASNSGNPHPATTSPNGVRAMVEVLKERGAGRVIVADQAGVEHVRRSQRGRYSTTRERFMTNGLGALEDVAELHFFDDGDWESGYVEATLPEGHHWPRGMRLAAIVKEVDHIVYMPRISAHTLAGLTNAQKSAIGWLRDDSRHDLHNDAASFYEKYTEISYTDEIKSRFRLALTLNESVQLFGGPDAGTVYKMNPPLVVASSSLANHDAMATSILMALQNTSGAQPTGMTYTALLAPTLNGFFAGGAGVGTGDAGAWVSESPSSRFSAHTFETSVDGERAVLRGWELSGGKPDSVQVIMHGEAMDDTLRGAVDAHGKGLYDFARFG